MHKSLGIIMLIVKNFLNIIYKSICVRKSNEKSESISFKECSVDVNTDEYTLVIQAGIKIRC
jgi:hypothetical protein